MKLVQQLCVAVLAGVVCVAGAQTVKVGEGSYWLAPQGGEKVPPAAPHRTPDMLKTAAQTNQWYSTLIFNAQPEVVFAQPLTVTVAGAIAPLVAGTTALPGQAARVVPHSNVWVVSGATESSRR